MNIGTIIAALQAAKKVWDESESWAEAWIRWRARRRAAADKRLRDAGAAGSPGSVEDWPKTGDGDSTGGWL